MRVKLFTHTDLDGVGCAILGRLAFKDNIDIEYCNYDDINEKVESFFYSENSFSDYDKVFITDISIKEELADRINSSFYTKNIKLIDHHSTALCLNKYDWAKVTEETVLLHYDSENEIKEKVSGTYLFFMELLRNDYLTPTQEQYEVFKQFADMVRKYDTWLWKTKYNDEEPKMWNDLFCIMGREEFVESIIYRLTHYDVFDFCDFDLKLLKYKQREIDKYIEIKNKQMTVKEIQGHQAGIIFAEQYHSELGNKLAELHPDLDFIVIINLSESVSYRSIGDEIHLGNDIAKIYGGGGHMNAAGSPISDGIRDEIIKMIF